MKPQRPHIALIIESSRGYGRNILKGIARYIRDHHPWTLYWQDRRLEETVPTWLQDWQGDGIIARIESRSMEKAVLAKGVPCVDVRGRFELDMPLIETNDQVVAELAVNHLLERGFKRFAYCGIEGVNYSERRLQYYPRILKQLGFDCLVYQAKTEQMKGNQRTREQHGIDFEQELVDWVLSLPRPIGVMACNDIRAQQLLNACRIAGVAVPDDLAVIGVDNDELICELSDPPLSSVEPDAEKVGYEAARLLQKMMDREQSGEKNPEKFPTQKTFIEPKGVVTRLSSDVLAMNDELISQAVRFIRQHACEGINVEDVLREIPLTRITLKRRFEKLLGRSPKAEILRVQLERVKYFLRNTDLTQQEIAKLCGFRHAEYMTVVFKQKFSITPKKFRNSH